MAYLHACPQFQASANIFMSEYHKTEFYFNMQGVLVRRHACTTHMSVFVKACVHGLMCLYVMSVRACAVMLSCVHSSPNVLFCVQWCSQARTVTPPQGFFSKNFRGAAPDPDNSYF